MSLATAFNVGFWTGCLCVGYAWVFDVPWMVAVFVTANSLIDLLHYIFQGATE